MSFLKGLANAIGAIQDAVNDEIKVERNGRVFLVRVEGRFHSPSEPWVYDVTATDLVTCTSGGEVKHFLYKEEGVEEAIRVTMTALREKGLLVDGGCASPTPVGMVTPLTRSSSAKYGQDDERTRGIMKTLAKKGLISNDNRPSSSITTATSTPPSMTASSTSARVHESVSHHEVPMIEPDHDGFYTSRTMPAATPEPAQLDPKSCYVTWESRKKGLVYILNNNVFPHLPENRRMRRGSEIDVVNVEHVFSELGYEPVVHTNLTSAEILTSLDSLVGRLNDEGDRHSSACFVFMSHGNEIGISGVDAHEFDPRIVTKEEIKEKLYGRRCRGLLGKPKLIFIQACRGHAFTRNADELDYSQKCADDDAPFEVDFVPPVETSPSLALDLDTATSSSPSAVNEWDVDGGGELPNNADIFVANATSNGYFSIRMSRDGSWFIQAISEIFLAHAHIDDLNELMRKVTCLVAETYRSRWPNPATKRHFEVRQTPAYESQGMRRRLFFLPKYQSS